MKKIIGIRFQLGASFKGHETIELCFEDGTNEFRPLSQQFVKELRESDVATHGTFAVEG